VLLRSARAPPYELIGFKRTSNVMPLWELRDRFRCIRCGGRVKRLWIEGQSNKDDHELCSATAIPDYRLGTITANQIRAARALLGWTQEQLSEATDLSLTVLNNVEREAVNPRHATLEKIQIALESGGIEILGGEQNTPDGGPGPRLRRT